MKHFFRRIILVLLLSCAQNSVLKKEASGQLVTYYVLPKAGVWLRSGPSKGSDKLQLIPHSEALRLRTDGGPPDSVDNRSGLWLSADFRGFKGFVFSGYLTEHYSQTILSKTAFGVETKAQFEMLESAAIDPDKRNKVLSKIIGYGLEWTRPYPDGNNAFRFCQAAQAIKFGQDNPNFLGTTDELVRIFIQYVNAGDSAGLSSIIGNTLNTGCYPCDSIVIRPKLTIIQEFDRLRYGGKLRLAKYSETFQGQPFFEIEVSLPTGQKPENIYLIRIKKTQSEHYIDGIFGSHGFKYNSKEAQTCELHG